MPSHGSPGDRRPPARADGPAGRRAGARTAGAGPPARPRRVAVGRRPGRDPRAARRASPFRGLVADAAPAAGRLRDRPARRRARPSCGPIGSTTRRGCAAHLRSGRDPESAVVWRLDRPHGLAGAEDELTRRRTYQPLGRFWALGPARRLARGLRPTPVRPNAADARLGAALCSAPAAPVAFGRGRRRPRGSPTAAGAGRWPWCSTRPTATSPGSRGRPPTSAAGSMPSSTSWATWPCTPRSPGRPTPATAGPAWLVLGMLYAMGKYLFVVAAAESGRAGGDGRPPDRARSPRAAVARADAASAWPGMPTSAGTSGSSWRRSGGSTWPWSPMRPTSRRGPSPGRSGRRSAMPEPRGSRS